MPVLKNKKQHRKIRIKPFKEYTDLYYSNLRFNILKRLQRRDELARKAICDLVIKESGRNESTVRRLIHRKKGEGKVEDFVILEQFAKIFSVIVEELVNP